MRYVILLPMVLVCACSRHETPAPSEPTAEPTEAAETPSAEPAKATTADETLSLDTPQSVELIDAGKPPHKELRATFEPGSTHKLQATADWVITAGYGPAVSVEAPMPSFVYELESEVKSTTDGTTPFEFRIANVTAKSADGVSPGHLQLAAKATEALRGLTGSFSLNARGMLQSFSLNAPADANALVHDMLDQVERALRLAILPLPEEPIGQGAKWTSTHVAEQRGARSKQTSTFELVSLKGSRAKVKLSQQATTPKQMIQLPGAPGNAKLSLDEMDFEGQGEGSWELGKVAPRSASETTVTLFKMMSSGPKREVVLMQNDTTLKVKGGR